MDLKHNKEMVMASLFENATEAIILTDRSGRIVLLNPCAEKMFGYSAEELIGKTIEVLVPENTGEKHRQLREAFYRQPANRAMGAGRDLYARRKDGSIIPVEISLSHYELNGEFFVIAFIIDITIRKHYEMIRAEQQRELERVSKELQKLNQELEQKVEDRTTMLRETLAQLEKSKAELEEALEKQKELNELKTRFISTVSHEFRTPLATMLSSASLLARYTKEEEQHKRDKHIYRIQESVRHLNNLLEDLLSLGKLEEGLVTAHHAPLHFSDYMQEFTEDIKEILKPGQQIAIEHTGPDTCYTDKRLLTYILLNLVTNAIKFSPENSVITIRCTNERDRYIISVSDRGIGIAPEDQVHLFERFFRAKNASNIQGTGLGLHIVSKYVEILRGRITFESKINEGSTFTIEIPQIISHEKENPID
ncbi:MAG: PAS domain-containing sensor histidine kinase [Chitinophagales bacterium]|nr:PAS domain-containing sensor histidine kinase [Chitinophagales bacterium]MDW8419007.1 PAS domain-containing sensor histidine kinase [Chitinophagales bacterium]